MNLKKVSMSTQTHISTWREGGRPGKVDLILNFKNVSVSILAINLYCEVNDKQNVCHVYPPLELNKTGI